MHAHTKWCPRPTHAARDQPLHLSPILPRDLLLEGRCRRRRPCSSLPNASSPSLPPFSIVDVALLPRWAMAAWVRLGA